MTKYDVIKLFKAVNDIKSSQNESKIKFKYFISKIAGAISKEIEVLRELETSNEALLADYKKEELAVYKIYGKEIPNGYTLEGCEKESQKKAQEELEVVRTKFKDVIDSYIAKRGEYETTILAEEITLDLYKVKLDECPDWITLEQVEILSKCNCIME